MTKSEKKDVIGTVLIWGSVIGFLVVLGSWLYLSHLTKQMQSEGITEAPTVQTECPAWLSDSPQKGCEK